MHLDLSSAAADAAVREGRPLLSAGTLGIDPDEVADELRRVAANLAETARPGTPALDAAARLATAALDLDVLLVPALEDDRDALEREARRLGVDATALGEIAQLAVQPALWEAAAAVRALTDTDRWERGYCVLCGSWPALAELVGPERRRLLRCARCGSSWSWLVLLCPYCGTDDHRELGSLTDADTKRGGRIDTCGRCHGYVKAIATFTPHSALRIVAEDVATLDLDVAAAEAGFRRPGDVARGLAGIPRLVREGRTVPG